VLDIGKSIGVVETDHKGAKTIVQTPCVEVLVTRPKSAIPGVVTKKLAAQSRKLDAIQIEANETNDEDADFMLYWIEVWIEKTVPLRVTRNGAVEEVMNRFETRSYVHDIKGFSESPIQRTLLSGMLGVEIIGTWLDERPPELEDADKREAMIEHSEGSVEENQQEVVNFNLEGMDLPELRALAEERGIDISDIKGSYQAKHIKHRLKEVLDVVQV